jgi:hypothetical protein
VKHGVRGANNIDRREWRAIGRLRSSLVEVEGPGAEPSHSYEWYHASLGY